MANIRKITEEEKIIQDFGKVMEMVSKEIITKYPALVFPASLLLHRKDRIKEALFISWSQTSDKSKEELIRGALAFLEGFIDDNEALKKNEKILQRLQ